MPPNEPEVWRRKPGGVAQFSDPQTQNGKVGPSPGSKFPIGSVESSQSRLFREATQLKTVGAVARVAGIEHPRFRSQIPHRDVARHRRTRPTVSVAADVPQSALAAAAVARGGVREWAAYR